MTDDGYEIIGRVFAQDEIERLREAVRNEAMHRTRAGARHLLSVPAVALVARDPRMVQIAKHFLGGQPEAFRATLFDKSSVRNWGVPWHQDKSLPIVERIDIPSWGPWSMKAGVQFVQAPAHALAKVVALRVHLDDSSLENGPLRVLPGSHRLGVLTQAEIADLATRTRAVDCVVPSGGVIAMHPLLVHASRKADDRRRRCVIHIEYAESRALECGLRLVVA